MASEDRRPEASVVDRPSYDAIDDHDTVIAWSKRYCERAARLHALDVDLARVEWTVSTRARRRAAAVRHPRIDGATAGEPVDWADIDVDGADVHVDAEHASGPPTCTVSLTWPAFEAFSRSEWRATLRHELIHVEQFQRTGTTGHGPDFRERAAELDVTAHCPSFAEPNYLLRCEECGDVVARRFRESRLVREPERYRSSCCGVSLSVESG